MTYADRDSKDYEALLTSEESGSIQEETLASLEKRPRSWAVIHVTVLVAYTLLFAFLIYLQSGEVSCTRGPDLIHCTFPRKGRTGEPAG
jgi:hypothetical protein